jgi:hypothetical protein
MSFIKQSKDNFVKFLFGKNIVPRELLDLHDYFRLHGPINFEYKQGDGVTIAVSTNFRFGSIVTSGKNEKELDRNIRDAILTSFDLPAVYAKESTLYRTDKKENTYALA